MAEMVKEFQSFREHLDEHNDRRERLIKTSRDITNISKKVIFLLHRLMNEGDLDDPNLPIRAANEARKKLIEAEALFASTREELVGDRFWRYERAVSPGLQEYIEALSYLFYLEHRSLINYSQVQRKLTDSEGIPYFPVPVSDYLLGISDLTGELMRFAISSISRRGGRSKAGEVCAFVRGCKADFERLTPYVWDLHKKQAVTAQSLQKIEDANYAIVVRTSEFDVPPEKLDDIVAQAISTLGAERQSGRTEEIM